MAEVVPAVQSAPSAQPVDKVQARVEAHFSKVNPPMKQLVDLFQLSLPDFKAALVPFVELTYPEQKQIASVKFLKEFVKNARKHQFAELSEEDFARFGAMLAKLHSEHVAHDSFQRFHLLELDFQTLEKYIKANAEYLDKLQIERRLEKVVKPDQIQKFVIKNTFLDDAPACIQHHQLKQIIAEIGEQLVKQKKYTTTTAQYLMVQFEFIGQFVNCRLPEVLSLPRSNTKEYQKALRLYLLRNWKMMNGDYIQIEGLLFSTQKEALDLQFSREASKLLAKPLFSCEADKLMSGSQLLTYCLLMANLLGYNCSFDQQKVIAGKEDEQLQLVVPALRGLTGFDIPASFAKLKLK